MIAPPRPPRPPDAVDREELEALIEEARKRARRRRQLYAAVAGFIALGGLAIATIVDRGAESDLASPAPAARSILASPAGDPKIAFMRGTPNRPDVALYVVNGDGSAQQRLAHTRLDARRPAWSPDGRKIAFLASSGRPDIYVQNLDGSAPRRLTHNPAGDRDPAWSPDGEKLAFTSYADRDDQWDVYVVNAGGGDCGS